MHLTLAQSTPRQSPLKFKLIKACCSNQLLKTPIIIVIVFIVSMRNKLEENFSNNNAMDFKRKKGMS